MFFENMVAFALARRLKERNPAIVTVLGGATCESPSGEEYMRHVPALDYVFSGPALQSFPRFVDNLLAGRGEENDRIPGVFSQANQGRGVPARWARSSTSTSPWRSTTSRSSTTSPRSSRPTRSRPCSPSRPRAAAGGASTPTAPSAASTRSTMSYRAMRPDLAVELIRSLFRYAGRASILMCVDNILQRQYVTEVFPYLETPESLAIFYQLKANLTEREVAAMAAARVKLITPGIESLSTATLKLMDKGVSAFHNLQVLKHCSLHDVHPGWNLLVGSPGEGAETYRKYAADLPRLVHLPPPQAIVSIHFNRYSPYFVRAKEYGLDLHPIDYYEMVYPFPPEAIANVAYDFMDHNFDAEYMRALAEWIGALTERIELWQRRHSDASGAPPPRLYLREREGGASVYDSRSGEPREIPLTATGRRVLARLEEPRRLAVLARELSDLTQGELMAEIDGFRDHGLLFEEDDKLMSLILPHEPPPMTFQAGALSSRARRREAAGAAAAVAGPIPRAARRAVKSGAPRGVA